MKKPITTILLSLLLIFSAQPPLFALEQTLILQQDVNGYYGVSDTWVSTEDWGTPPQNTVNYGENQLLTLGRDGDNNLLLHFDLSAIPANSEIISVRLELYNQTESGSDGQDYPRRINLYQVLTDWDAGNQISTPIDAPGKHGATGENAFTYFPGEGGNIAWDLPGMEAGTDYKASSESFTDVINPGWYVWDITALTRAWIRGEQANFGVVLRDVTGWQEGNRDWREFASSQNSTIIRRPRLVIHYNPDVPFVDAGPDQENLSWNGGAISLDGSGSHDCPGGNDAGLTYSWEIVKAACASTMSGILSGSSAGISFTPDRAGEWQIALTVTNAQGESASDIVRLRLLSLSPGHPRIYLTPAKLSRLRNRASAASPRWLQLKAEADANDGTMLAKALVYQISQTPLYGNQALDLALAQISDSNDWPTKAGDIALVFDWCYDLISSSRKTIFINYFNSWGQATPKAEDFSGWGNYWPRYGYSYALIGLVSFGDNPQAQNWLNEFRQRRFNDIDLPLLNKIASGGAWPEGTIYDWIANYPRVKAIQAWLIATGEDLFAATSWFKERLGYLLLKHWPGTASEWGHIYHPYPATGDTERNRGSMANYGRIMALILADRYQNESLATQLQACLNAAPANGSMSFLAHEEFLWFDPDLPRSPPQLLSHYAVGTGTLLIRSGWPDAAADTRPEVTYATFQCGDHFSYHQHYDQNSFTLFKYAPLAIDSGVYSGEGLSSHDINYYVRTIAHNTLIVYNPDEDFSAARPDATSNDGGQRSMYGASRAPQTLDYFTQHSKQYETGDLRRYFDGENFTYALGDATAAYNNAAYNQAQDTGLSGNRAKLSRFQREFVYLRPQSANASEYLVLFDRIGVTETTFSGANTKLLFHLLNEPSVNGTANVISPGETLYSGSTQAIAGAGDGRLYLNFLLPRNHNVRKVGGRGEKAFWVFGENYDWQWSESEAQPRPTNDFEDTPYGEWRLELESGDNALEHNFLAILEPAAHSDEMPSDCTLVTSAVMSGCRIVKNGLNYLLLFSSAVAGEAPAGTIVYDFPQIGTTTNILFDLPPGAHYSLTTSLSDANCSVVLTPSVNGEQIVNAQGVLRFSTSGSSDANIIYVDNAGFCSGKTPCCTSITQALAQAGVGDIIKAQSGSYPESLTVNNHGLLMLQGGWGSNYSFVSGTATVNSVEIEEGILVLNQGSLSIGQLNSSAGGHITYTLNNGQVYRIEAREGAVPENISQALEALAPQPVGARDAGLNISPDGKWLLLETERFSPDCVGWAGLAVIKGDLSRGEALKVNGDDIHPEGFSAIASGGNRVIYPQNDGTHSLDLFAVSRDLGGSWQAPVEISKNSTFTYNNWPAVNAEGTKVLFNCSNEPYSGTTSICEVGVDGSGFRVVLTPAASPSGLPDAGDLQAPDYAPDGSIVFEAAWPGEEIWRLAPGAAIPGRISASAAYNNDNSPTVLPNGNIASLWLSRPGGLSVHELKVMTPDGRSYFMALTDVDVADIGLGSGR